MLTSQLPEYFSAKKGDANNSQDHIIAFSSIGLKINYFSKSVNVECEYIITTTPSMKPRLALMYNLYQL